MAVGRERAYYKALRRVAATVNSEASLKQVLDAVVRATARAMEAGASLMLLDSTGMKLVHTSSWGLRDSYLHKGVLDVGKSLSEVVTGEPVAVADVATDERIQYPELAAREGISSMLGVPLVLRGQPVGSLRVYSREQREFSSADVKFVTALANLAAVAIHGNTPLQPGLEAQAATGQGGAGTSALRQARSVTFAHPSEEEFARLLDFYSIEWVYEPRSFPLRWVDTTVAEMFTPDFLLPGLGLYVELTTLKQSLVTEKNRKLRRLRELYPDVKITLLYKKDFERLLAKYGFGPLAQTQGRSIGRVLYSSAEIQQRVRELAEQISRDYAGRHPVVVGVLRGVFCFMADLMRQMTVPLEIDFMAISYYSHRDRSTVKVTRDVDIDVTDRHVIMVEDIVDTGMTLNYMLTHIQTKRPASLTVCTLLDKRVRRIVDVPLEYVGFEVPDEFVVGYGLDYLEQYRNLPFIGVLSSAEQST
ncbi:MAG: hypoxanthine phosphoribosyltransferase, partial [Chloroflexota bacterium]